MSSRLDARAYFGTGRLSRNRPMRPEEGTYLAHCQGNPLFGLLPRKYTHFRLRREHGGLHGDRIWMCWYIIREDQYGRLAIADEIARHSKNEVGVIAVHLC